MTPYSCCLDEVDVCDDDYCPTCTSQCDVHSFSVTEKRVVRVRSASGEHDCDVVLASLARVDCEHRNLVADDALNSIALFCVEAEDGDGAVVRDGTQVVDEVGCELCFVFVVS